MNTSSFSGKRLIEERKRLGYKSQAAAAKKCGVSGRMWGDYERGVSQPKAEQLFQFEKAGIDIDYVMHGVRHTERPSEASCTSSASKPYMANGSSSLLAISVSSVSVATPAS